LVSPGNCSIFVKQIKNQAIMSKREFIPYFMKIDVLIAEIVNEIIDMLNEHNTKKVHLPYPLALEFDARFVGDEEGVHEITDIAIDNNGFVAVFTEDGNPYYLYNLSKKTDITHIYCSVYDYFYR
jgi:hypothetical protein